MYNTATLNEELKRVEEEYNQLAQEDNQLATRRNEIAAKCLNLQGQAQIIQKFLSENAEDTEDTDDNDSEEGSTPTPIKRYSKRDK